MGNLSIDAYKDNYKPQNLNDWENSFLATLDYLAPADFEKLKHWFYESYLFCFTKNNTVSGFVGVD